MARYRFIGHNPHTLRVANVIAVDVVHGTEFEMPEKWEYVFALRGTPVVRVEEAEVAPEAMVEAEIEEPAAAAAEDAKPRRSRRRKGDDSAG